MNEALVVLGLAAAVSLLVLFVIWMINDL